MGQVHAEQGRFCCGRGGGGASSGSHHFSAAFQLPGLDLSADPLPPPVAARIARSRSSLCSVPTQEDRAVGAPGKWVKPSAARCHRHCPQGALSCPAALRQVSPLVTQLFRVSFLGSCHITRLMSTQRFVINPPARSTATVGR